MKDGSIGNPDIYLGAKVKQMELPNGVKAWALSSSKYIQEAMQNCKKYLAHSMNRRKLIQKAPNPFPGDYDPDLDTMDVLKDDQATYLQSQIRILGWMVELGRVDIATEVSLLSLHVNCICLSNQIMLMTRSNRDQGQDFAYSLIWHV